MTMVLCMITNTTLILHSGSVFNSIVEADIVALVLPATITLNHCITWFVDIPPLYVVTAGSRNVNKALLHYQRCSYDSL